MADYKLEDFLDANLNKMLLADKNTVNVYIGKRGSGKSVQQKYVSMVQTAMFPERSITVLSGHGMNEEDWKKSVPHLFCQSGKTAELVETLENILQTQIKLCKKFVVEDVDIPEKYKVTVILDDCGSLPKFLKSHTINNIITNGRHYGINLVILLQDIMQISKTNRSNIDYVFLFKTSNSHAVKQFYDMYISECDSWVDFKKIYKLLTNDFGCLWVDNKNPFKRSIKDELFKFKIPTEYIKLDEKGRIDSSVFGKFGSESQWRQSEKHYVNIDEKRDLKESTISQINEFSSYGYEDDFNDEPYIF
jgi:hypothetical protein